MKITLSILWTIIWFALGYLLFMPTLSFTFGSGLYWWLIFYFVVLGFATYEFLLKDKAGLMKLIALVNVHDHTIVGIGENRRDAVRDYRSHMASRGNAVAVGASDLEVKTLTSTISRVVSDVRSGNTDYYMMINGRPGTIFTASSSTSIEVPLTRDGDAVTVSFTETDRQEIQLISFDNLDITMRHDNLQTNLDRRIDTTRENRREQQVDKSLDNRWDKMSPQEKEALMKKK